MALILIPAILGVFAVADWVAVARRRRTVEYVCKPAVLVVLTAVVASGLVAADSPGQRRWFVLALLFSLAGDVFLMLPRDRFVFGLGSFLLAHVFYVAGFAAESGPLSAARFLGAAQVVAVLGLLVGGRVLRALGPSPLRGPVVAYMAVISLMVAVAAASGDWLALAGALLFYWSDAAIAWNKFVNPFPEAKVLIIVTYHLAQFALVGSLAL